MDDSSELSSAEELNLLNEGYNVLQLDRAWEWNKGEHTGTQSTTLPYIDLPSDFRYFVPNADSGNNYGNISVAYVGSDFAEYPIVSFSKRRNYRNMDGYAYLDLANNRLQFTKQPTSAKSVEFDYVMKAPALTLDSSPLFNEIHHEILAYWMAANFDPIQLTAKAESYQRENEVRYMQKLELMQLEDAYQKTSFS